MKNAKDSKELKSIKKIKEICQDISLDKLETFIKRPGTVKKSAIELQKKFENKTKVSIIVGDLDYARLHFTAHFNDSDATQFIHSEEKNNQNLWPTPLEKEGLDNFMREFVNQTTAGLKQVLETTGQCIPAFSLPIITRSSDAIFFQINEDFDKTLTIKDCWNLTLNHSSITCQVHFEIYDTTLFFNAVEKAKYERNSFVEDVFINTNFA